MSAGDAAVDVDGAAVRGDDRAGKSNAVAAKVIDLVAKVGGVVVIILGNGQMAERIEQCIDGRLGFVAILPRKGEERGKGRWSAEDLWIAPASFNRFIVVFPDQN